MPFLLAKSAEVAMRREADAPGKADPLVFSIARILLVAALIGAPLAFGAVNSWAWMSLALIACFVLLLWAVGSVQQGTIKLIWSPLYVPVALFFLLGLVQYGARLTLDRRETRAALVLLPANLTIFFISAQLFASASTETRGKFGLTVLFFAGGLGLFSILQFASGTQKIYWSFDTSGNFFGPYGNSHHYAGLMEMLIPVGTFYIAERRKFVAALALPVAAVTIAVASLLLSGSRSGLLALSAEIVIVLALRRREVRTTGGRSLLPIGATVLAAVLLFSWVDQGWVAKHLEVVADPRGAWAEWSSFRKSVALDSLRMLRDHPVFGIGLGNFETAYPQYQSFPTDLTVDYAHNDYVEAMAETGLVGTVLIFSAMVLFLRLSFRDWGRRLSSGDSWVAMGAAAP